MRLSRPSSWPVALKLSLAFLVAALVPMGATAAYNLHQALASVRRTAHLNLELVAGTTAARLDQLVTDTRHSVAQLAADAEVLALLRAGTCVVATHPDNLGHTYAFRSYYREALVQGDSVSELLTGSTTARPGVFFSRAVRDVGGTAVGVVVLKLQGESLMEMVGSLRLGEGGHGFLVDEYGVILSHTERRLLFHTLMPLSPEVLRLPVFDRRFASVGLDTLPSLRLEPLGPLMLRGRAEPVHVSALHARES